MALPEKKPYERLSAYLERTLPAELEKPGKSRAIATAELIAEYNKEPSKEMFAPYVIGYSNSNGLVDVIAEGGIVTTEGDFKTHTFISGSGTFTISSIPFSAETIPVSILVVGGGGGGGSRGSGGPGISSGAGGGGGAGGVVIVPINTGSLGVGTWAVTVGEGAADTGADSKGANGEDSSFVSGSTTIVAKGGGGGGTVQYTGGSALNPGGSGGGGYGYNSNIPPSPVYNGGAVSNQTTFPGALSFGNDGADGIGSSAGTPRGGGGGGATQDGINTGQCNGGDGIQWSTATYGGDGSSVGGGGGAGGARAVGPNGGSGGGGAGASEGADPPFSEPGTPNTGGGGGGGRSDLTGSGGGSGVVKIRYKYKNIA